jgi:prepilin-type N-terminal cleavage/methylation domain-containing protein
MKSLLIKDNKAFTLIELLVVVAILLEYYPL